MATLNLPHTVYIENVLRTAQIVNIDNVVICPDGVAGIDSDRRVVMLQTESVPSFPFGAIGVNRIDVFLSRLALAKSCDNFSVQYEAATDQNTKADFARQIVFKGDGVKVEYRCAHPRTILTAFSEKGTFPKNFNDPRRFSVQLTPEAALLLTKATSAMGADLVTLVSDDDGVHLKLSDINSDEFSHTFAPALKEVGEATGKTAFSQMYPAKLLLSLFKQNSQATLYLGQRGTLSMSVNDLNVIVIPTRRESNV